MDDNVMKEQYKAFEDITVRNINSVVQFSKETRELVRKLEKQVTELKDMVLSKDQELALVRQQLAKVQAVLYRGGTN